MSCINTKEWTVVSVVVATVVDSFYLIISKIFTIIG